MYPDEFEEAFSEFLDGKEYDTAETALFALVRLAFAAGWNAAKRDSIRLLEGQEG